MVCWGCQLWQTAGISEMHRGSACKQKQGPALEGTEGLAAAEPQSTEQLRYSQSTNPSTATALLPRVPFPRGQFTDDIPGFYLICTNDRWYCS